MGIARKNKTGFELLPKRVLVDMLKKKWKGKSIFPTNEDIYREAREFPLGSQESNAFREGFIIGMMYMRDIASSQKQMRDCWWLDKEIKSCRHPQFSPYWKCNLECRHYTKKILFTKKEPSP